MLSIIGLCLDSVLSHITASLETVTVAWVVFRNNGWVHDTNRRVPINGISLVASPSCFRVVAQT
jgi:hypothetical protein